MTVSIINGDTGVATDPPPRRELALGGALGDGRGARGDRGSLGGALTLNSDGGEARYLPTTVEGLIVGDLKLLLGTFADAIWTGPHFPNTTTKPGDWDTTADCTSGCLFNLTSDPTEHYDIAKANPATVAQMKARIAEINATAFSPQRGTADPSGCEVALQRYGGFWGPFVGL